MPRLRIRKSETERLARLLALVMTVADLSGRTRVIEEVRQELGRKVRARLGVSFREGIHDIPPSQKTAEGEASDLVLRRPALFAEGEILAPEKLEPTDALAFFRQRIGMTDRAFARLEARYRLTAFTVANIESVALVERIQALLDEALAQGRTRAQFVADAQAAMESAGVTALKSHHLETVFSTNAHAAYSAGRMHQMLQPDVRRALPWWRYRTVGDGRVRPNHRKLDGFLARHDDPIWGVIAPPNGFRCRCGLFAVSRAEARRLAAESGQEIDKAGRSRLPAQPDAGFADSPVVAFQRRIEEGTL